MTYSRSTMPFWMLLLVAPTLTIAGSLDAPIVGTSTQQSADQGGHELQVGTLTRIPSQKAVPVPAYQEPTDDEDC